MKTNDGFEITKVFIVSKKAHFEIMGNFIGFYYWVLLSFSANTLLPGLKARLLCLSELFYLRILYVP